MSEVSTAWFTSDTHFGHEKVAAERGFSSSTAHDAHIIRTWNALVNDDDIVWHLGDVGLGPDHITLRCLKRLAGRKRLITGNHDALWPGHKNRPSAQFYREWLQVFESVQPFGVISLNNQRVMLSHFPYAGDHTSEDRFTQFRLRDEGAPLLHGHIHQKKVHTGLWQVHVGWDAWEQPASMMDVSKALINSAVIA